MNIWEPEELENLIKTYKTDPVIKFYLQRVNKVLDFAIPSIVIWPNGPTMTKYDDQTIQKIKEIEIEANKYILDKYSDLFPEGRQPFNMSLDL